MATLNRLLALCALLCAALPAGVVASGDGPVEAGVKATYIVKFTHYVTWPASALGGAGAPVVICIVGRDPFGPTIDAAAKGERVDQHPVVVRRRTSIDRDSGCDVAYLAGDVARRALPSIDGMPILSVTDASETHERGIFHFEVRGGHVGFHIDDKRAGRGGLEISSRLLSLAFSVASRAPRP